MMTKRVLVTGAGGPAALGTMKALADANIIFYFGDMDPLASGLYLVPKDRRCILPRGDDPAFVDALFAFCCENRIDVLWPTVDTELLPVAKARSRFESMGIKVALAPQKTLETCLDKWWLYQSCRFTVPCPETIVTNRDAERWSARFPRIVKPRRGSGSRGIHYIESLQAYQSLDVGEECIMQEYLPGEEYSIDVFVSHDAAQSIAVPRRRAKVDSGVAVTCETIHSTPLQRFALLVAQRIELSGIANVQVRLDHEGRPKLLEVNPRVAGTMILSVEAVVNLPQLMLNDTLGEPVTVPDDYRDLAVVRVLQEVYLEPGEIRAMCIDSEIGNINSEEIPHSAA
ncbi:MAG: ATP-grasp domain-containing protein [Polyangiaceae bacterium]|nr:ATP-grasp domain-containing protein [Polyangiaceae bacterium]